MCCDNLGRWIFSSVPILPITDWLLWIGLGVRIEILSLTIIPLAVLLEKCFLWKGGWLYRLLFSGLGTLFIILWSLQEANRFYNLNKVATLFIWNLDVKGSIWKFFLQQKYTIWSKLLWFCRNFNPKKPCGRFCMSHFSNISYWEDSHNQLIN